MDNTEYEFTNTWSGCNVDLWTDIMQKLRPQRMAEIGCYEGQHVVEMLAHPDRPKEFALECVDPYEPSAEFPAEEIEHALNAFTQNVLAAQQKHGGGVLLHRKRSATMWAKWITQNKKFDAIYIDGSHSAPDVLIDAVGAIQCLDSGGVVVFDDYVWGTGPQYLPLTSCPKVAVDAFTACFWDQIVICHQYPARQLVVVKR